MLPCDDAERAEADRQRDGREDAETERPGKPRRDDDPDHGQEDPGEQAAEQDQREGPAERDVADPVAVLREGARGFGDEEGDQPHRQPTAEPADDDADRQPGEPATGDIPQDLPERPRGDDVRLGRDGRLAEGR